MSEGPIAIAIPKREKIMTSWLCSVYGGSCGPLRPSSVNVAASFVPGSRAGLSNWHARPSELRCTASVGALARVVAWQMSASLGAALGWALAGALVGSMAVTSFALLWRGRGGDLALDRCILGAD